MSRKPQKRGPGRPMAYILSREQEEQIKELLRKMYTVRQIIAFTKFPETAVRRVQRELR